MARRQDLLRKRRDELVTMPHTIRRVIVARAARAAASTAAIICGVALIAVALSPKLAVTIASGLPGINPAVISTAVGAAWVLGLVAFAISRGRAEHRFAVAMSTYVLPGENLDHDIERLSHERPDRVAREMAHRLEVASAALPVAAAAFVVPATLIYVAQAIAVRGWPSTATYEGNLAQSGTPLLYCALAGVVAAIVMTRANARRDSIVPFAAIASLLSGAVAAVMLVDGNADITWIASAMSVISGTIAFVTWRLSRERKALDIDDPAAGSELFTIRGALASLRSVISSARRHVSPKMVVGVTAFGVLLAVAGGPFALGPPSAVATAAAPRVAAVAAPRPAVVTPGKTSLLAWTATEDGRIRYDVRFVDGKPLSLADLHGFQMLPKGWRGRVFVTLVENNLPGAIAVTPFPNSPDVFALHFGADSTEHRFATSACAEDLELGLHLIPDSDWTMGTYEASFIVEPHLELASCPVQ